MNNYWSKLMLVDNLNLERLGKEQKLPDDVPCIYFLFNEWELVYVGETTNLRKRVHHHYWEKQDDFPITYDNGVTIEYYAPFNKVGYLPLENVGKKLRWHVEQSLIDDFEPKYNKDRWIS